MKKTNKEWSDDADSWFFDLGSMAKRIELNEKRHYRARLRQNVTFAFVVLAFLLLSYRSEVNSDRIDKNTGIIAIQQENFQQAQIRSCASGLLIIAKYNKLQDDQIKIELQNKFIDDSLRKKRILAHLNAKIVPAPNCDAFTGARE